MTAQIKILTLFPEAVDAVLGSSILRRAQAKGLVALQALDMKQATAGKYQQVDDSPYGGGHGMLLKADVLERSLEQELESCSRENLKVVCPLPRGVVMNQAVFEQSAHWLREQPERKLLLVAGRYEGLDERFVKKWVDLEVSLGDFVLSGGELPALCFVDGVVRLLPQVLGDEQSARQDSFSTGLLEHPQYTKPAQFSGTEPPEVLRSGNHQRIAEWKVQQSLWLSYCYRPDLIRAHTGAGLPDWAQQLLEELKSRLTSRD